VSCYTRHLEDLLPAAPSAADKRALDRAVRQVLGMADADCPEVWAEFRARREQPAFITAVLEARIPGQGGD
jgi:hypothetical protein